MSVIPDYKIITPDDFEFLKSIGVPYTGYVKGIGYTCPVYVPAQAFKITDGNVQWNCYELHPLFYQAIDDSPENVFFSMGYTAEDIAERITHDNGNGTITVTWKNQSVTLPKKQSKVNISMMREGGNQGICIEVIDSRGNIVLSSSEFVSSNMQHSLQQGSNLVQDSENYTAIYQTIDNINTGVGAFGIGLGAKTELIDYGIRNYHKYSWKQFDGLSDFQKLKKECEAIGKTGVKYLRGTKNILKYSSVGSSIYSVVSIVTAENEEEQIKQACKAVLDITFTFIGKFGPWGFTISSMYYLLDTVTDGFYYFNDGKE